MTLVKSRAYRATMGSIYPWLEQGSMSHWRRALLAVKSTVMSTWFVKCMSFSQWSSSPVGQCETDLWKVHRVSHEQLMTMTTHLYANWVSGWWKHFPSLNCLLNHSWPVSVLRDQAKPCLDDKQPATAGHAKDKTSPALSSCSCIDIFPC